MTILQKPDALSLSGNIKEFRIGTTDTISFVLQQGGEDVVSRSYSPGADGIVIINIKDIVHARLSFLFKNSSVIYEQPSLVSTFKAIISGTQVTFQAIRTGVDMLADSATNFLTQNFLTWQPSIKPVTYYSPEFLTYYATLNCKAKLHAYFTDQSGNVISQNDIDLAELQTGKAYTIPLQYASVAERLGHRLPAYYDVCIENLNGERLTYVQRYYASDMKSETEQWVLFENSLGGIDTFRAYGSSDFTGEHTHNIAEIEDVSLEYRVDTIRKFQKNTGYLNMKERRWLLDFFPSLKKYLYINSYFRSIIVVESNVSYTDKELPSNYTFTYKYADAKPFLNLPRTDLPSEALEIVVPEVGSFTVPPRLVEFPRLLLSEGALFPIQEPYSEKWYTTTIGAINDYVTEQIGKKYDGVDTVTKFSKDVMVTIDKIGYYKAGDIILSGTTIEDAFIKMVSQKSTGELKSKISTANDVEFGSQKGFITYTAIRNGQGPMEAAFYDDASNNKLNFSEEIGGVQTAVRQLEGIYTQNETYKATVIYSASEDGNISRKIINNTISVNVRRKWFAGVCNSIPASSAEVRTLATSGLYNGPGTYKFEASNWKIIAICIPEGSISSLEFAEYPGNLIKDVEMVSGPSKISVEGVNGSAATDYNMWIVKTAIVNETTNHATLKIS